MNKRLDRAGRGPRLHRRARLAQLDAPALERTDPEPLADESVEVDTAGEQVATSRRGIDLQPVLDGGALELLGLDQRQLLLRPARVEVAVPCEPLAGHGRHRLDGMWHVALRGADEDRLDASLAHASNRTDQVPAYD